MAWQFTYEGEAYREDDLTLDGAEAIEDAITAKLRQGQPEHRRVTWSEIAPLRSAMHAKIVMSHMIAERTNVAVEVAAKELGQLSANEVIGMVEPIVDDLPTEFNEGNPPVAGEPSTGM